MIDYKQILPITIIMIMLVCCMLVVGMIVIRFDDTIDTTYSKHITITETNNDISENTNNFHLQNMNVEIYNGTAWNPVSYTYLNGMVVIPEANL